MLTDSKKCKVCGNTMSIYATKCNNCGTIEPHKRHPFITFWLWLGAIINGLLTVGYFLLLFSSKGLWTATPEPTLVRLFWLVGSVGLLIGYIMLIKWKKNGFYIVLVVGILNIITTICTVGFAVSIISSIIGLILLYGILNIKKDGVEYWLAMDLDM